MHCKQYDNMHIMLSVEFRNLNGDGLSNDCFVTVGNQKSLAYLR